jgi:hypothetical protein
MREGSLSTREVPPNRSGFVVTARLRGARLLNGVAGCKRHGLPGLGTPKGHRGSSSQHGSVPC